MGITNIVRYYYSLEIYLLDHELKIEIKHDFAPDIGEDVDLFKARMRLYKDIMDAINEKHETTFIISQIRHRILKVPEETKGKAHLDAYEFIKFAEEDVQKNDRYCCYMKKSNNEFNKCLYIFRAMLTYSDYFLDFILIDSTYRRNRSNLAPVNTVRITKFVG